MRQSDADRGDYWSGEGRLRVVLDRRLMDDAIWLDAHHLKLREALRTCRDVETLRKIADVLRDAGAMVAP